MFRNYHVAGFSEEGDIFTKLGIWHGIIMITQPFWNAKNNIL